MERLFPTETKAYRQIGRSVRLSASENSVFVTLANSSVSQWAAHYRHYVISLRNIFCHRCKARFLVEGFPTPAADWAARLCLRPGVVIAGFTDDWCKLAALVAGWRSPSHTDLQRVDLLAQGLALRACLCTSATMVLYGVITAVTSAVVLSMSGLSVISNASSTASMPRSMST